MKIAFPKNKKSITLIGMAGVGKSFIGRRLAKLLDFEFIDTDDVLEEKTGHSLQELLDQKGEVNFIKLESQTITNLGNIQNKIISPGGSVIYSAKAMDFLKNNSNIVYLADSYGRIINRVKNLNNRGIVGLKNKSFEQLYAERKKLYKKSADLTINLSYLQTDDKELKAKEVTEKIIAAIEKLS